ncbi:hypothetical protein DFA_04924 [Cavenderia fasciculata]|uniref:Uncharacterized protein n=1 Tax=Cavenderia fasciculata TaxID=261658 RepID=F4PME4_CACFS|nr:uncharacterized protein DFA_04924 [Cavenderia fasciculata]EGG22794.1 hypothetical protein DFA_04924 [Cavenderia fasciculata]|eukprot:XP_004360645.1 hypothetical protein DFA_04924 [Cavenderia fasciculata]
MNIVIIGDTKLKKPFAETLFNRKFTGNSDIFHYPLFDLQDTISEEDIGKPISNQVYHQMPDFYFVVYDVTNQSSCGQGQHDVIGMNPDPDPNQSTLQTKPNNFVQKVFSGRYHYFEFEKGHCIDRDMSNHQSCLKDIALKAQYSIETTHT